MAKNNKKAKNAKLNKKAMIAVIIAAVILVGAIAAAVVQLLREEAPAAPVETSAVNAAEASAEATDFIEIEIENYGVITAELYGGVAPITVENFMKLVDEDFYDGLTFHRIISGFMIQGGDPLGNGMGGSAEKIKGEFAANGVKNDIEHTRGVLSMARSQAKDSASSQFFIMHADAPHLNGQYAAFGRVLSGMEFVDAICEKTPVYDQNGSVMADDQPVIREIRRIEKPES